MPAPALCTCPRVEVLSRFRQLHSTPPAWAWPFSPSIPFVGARYQSGSNIMVYASAENFSWMHKKDIPTRFQDERAWDRYRAVYEESGRNSESFFPNVGIQPVTDGGLLAAAWFTAERLGLALEPEPRPFLETIAVGNWCKFAIKAQTNEDYIADVTKLAESLPFVVTELVLLAPKVVLLPKAVWQHPLLRGAMRGAAPFTRFIPVPQFNATVVNCHLARFDSAAQQLRTRYQTQPLGRWMENLHGFREANAWRYLALLDEALQKPTS